MFKIGEFSKLVQVPVPTLRYYDQVGLLKPIEVDPLTGYRYYSASQMPRLNRILALKGLGFSLEQIAAALDEGLTPEQMRGMLRLRHAQISQQLSLQANVQAVFSAYQLDREATDRATSSLWLTNGVGPVPPYESAGTRAVPSGGPFLCLGCGGRAAYVGDSSFDTGAARAAGLPCVACRFGFNDLPVDELGATAVIGHFDELIGALEGL